ncbi:hypothetical protein [Pontibacter saemangeumensis]|uniref:hypothetical protein n=1 Tax=Pontibacter saemangeumensis TaxID=1084525 RepID=UPI0031E8866F
MGACCTTGKLCWGPHLLPGLLCDAPLVRFYDFHLLFRNKSSIYTGLPDAVQLFYLKALA